MGFWSWILLGLIAGAIGKVLMPGKDPGGIVITILLGVGGAFLGGWAGTQMGWGEVTGPMDMRSLGLATGGAVVILLAYRLIFGKKK